jgi:rRNA-processing protein FCF1
MALSQMLGLDLFSELDRILPGTRELIVLHPVKHELEKLNNSGSLRVKREAQFALSFVEKYCQLWETDYQHKNVDFVLLYYGEKFNGFIATNDRKLKRLARNKKIKILYIRNQRYLVIQ